MTWALLGLVVVLTAWCTIQQRALSALWERTNDLSRELDGTDRWLGIGAYHSDRATLDEWIHEVAREHVEPVDVACRRAHERLTALEPRPPAPAEEPWEAWLRECERRRAANA